MREETYVYCVMCTELDENDLTKIKARRPIVVYGDVERAIEYVESLNVVAMQMHRVYEVEKLVKI